ncbi:efflux RND transporter periplasmic adaptor subunit [Marinicauda salina]|uniref:Efflux RND transporter periplasmic adaptor subunit n=1 Tax=Marinicauda salina TaxID=2135793 RepID=A0A2U2BXX8_9PROT|nr:efflux RND transporter periplasmic adaptor subunit [Marinicauda salina]PWE18824.1 efflux RND transporter periplasmic adaptor subunit [Marinicauda salina]
MRKSVGRLILFGLPAGLAVTFFIVFTTLVQTAPQPERADFTPQPTAVFVTEAETSPVRLTVRTQGEVRPLTEISLTAQVSGRIQYVNPSFVDGGFFEAGETLIRLEDEDYQLAVTRAEALVAQRRQQLIREEAESDLARQEWEAIGEGEASPLTLRQPQLADARAQLAAAEASLAEARLNLRRTRISAPFDGRVREKMADVGQYVSPGVQIGRVFSTNVAQVRLPLTDAELGQLGIPVAFRATEDTPGPSVALTATVAGERREWTGELVRTDSAIDPRTRTMSAMVEVDDPYGAAAEETGAPLAVGLFVDAAIEGRAIEQAYILPRSALRGENQVYVAEPDGTLSIRNATVINTTADQVVLASGVEAGERVVTSPVRGAADGMSITPLGPDGQPLDETDAESDDDEAEGEQTSEAAVARAG